MTNNRSDTTTKCKRCPATIRFCRMIKKSGEVGALAPVDVVPSATGNIRLVTTGTGEVQGRVLGGDDLERARAIGEILHTSHFVSCDEAASFRKHR